MYETKHPAYSQLGKIGREITGIDASRNEETDSNKLQAVVVFSAHWQARRKDTIEINMAEKTDLIYE